MWSPTLYHGWWVSLWEDETDPSLVRCGRYRLSVMLSDCRYTRFRNLNSTVPVDVVRVKSYVDSLLNSMRVPVRVSVNKRNFVPERIMPDLIGVFRNVRSLSSWKPYIPLVLYDPLMHVPSCFANLYFAAFTRNLIHYSILFSWIHRILRLH